MSTLNNPLLEAKGITKYFGTITALENVDLKVHAGECLGVVGDNGAGKSTQLRILAGLEEVTTGEVVLEGQPRIAYLQEEFYVDVKRTVREEMFQAFADAAIVLYQIRDIEKSFMYNYE